MVRVELCRELELVRRAHYHSELVGPGEDSEQVRDEASFTELVAVSTINIFQLHQSHYPRPPNSLSPLLRPYCILHNTYLYTLLPLHSPLQAAITALAEEDKVKLATTAWLTGQFLGEICDYEPGTNLLSHVSIQYVTTNPAPMAITLAM